MIRQLDPWAHRETSWSAELAAQSESILSLSNGYLGIRGTLDEREPAALPGTYLNGFYEHRRIPYAERGHGDPEFDEVLVRVADGTRVAISVEDEPLDIRTGRVLEHERVLDLRAGLLSRSLRWRSARGREVCVRSRRLVSLLHRELAAIEYEVEAVGEPMWVRITSELGAEPGMEGPSADPRAGGWLPADTLVGRLERHRRARAVLVHETRLSRNVVAAGMDHLLNRTAGASGIEDATKSGVRWSMSVQLAAGAPARIVKLLAYHWSEQADVAPLAAAVERSLDLACNLGFESLVAEQRAAWDEVWAGTDIELEGDPEIQHALRYGLFQLHQNAACATGHAIPAKGLTGPGYSGHTFWDTEIFVLPVLTYCAPRVVADQLRWRASTLPKARANARRLGLRGAAFPWRTIAGEECSGYLPAGSAALHINADIAHAVVAYFRATGDEAFEREVGAPLLVETARMWISAGHHDERRAGRFSIDRMTGPDEYSVLVDNNLYTNLMARANLRAAADAVDRLGAAALSVDPDEVRQWRRAADAMTIPYDTDLEIHLQDEDFTRHAPFDFEALTPADYPLLLHVPYFQLYRHQVIKQPDLVLAMHLCGEAFTTEEKRRNFAYYEALTVRDSSLASGTEAVLAAEVGDTELAYEYLAEAALLDHHDIYRNTADGLHLAALAGGWTAVIAGLAGAREHGGRLAFAPRLPSALTRIAFPLMYRGRRLQVEISQDRATYRLDAGLPLEVDHWGSRVSIVPGGCVVADIPPAAAPPPRLRQPAGRAPAARNRSAPVVARPGSETGRATA